MKNIMKFDDKEVDVILNALKAASDDYSRILENLSNDETKNSRLIQQFQRQLEETEALINKIESLGY